MSRRPKFRPVVSRVKLNPEQAVLACSCFSNNVARGTFVTAYRDGTFMQMCQTVGFLREPAALKPTANFSAPCNSTGSLYSFGASSS